MRLMIYDSCKSGLLKLSLAAFMLLTTLGTIHGAEIDDEDILPLVMSPGRRFSFEIGDIIILSVIVLCCFALFILIRGIKGIIVERIALRRDAAALVSGELMPSEKHRRAGRVKRQVGGLRLKLVVVTMVLVLLVNVLASVPLYMLMAHEQRETLTKGLWERSSVLLEGLASSARIYLSQGNIAAMNLLLAQIVSVPEAHYITITGYNPEVMVFDDRVWASNDPDIHRKIDSTELVHGFSRIHDAVSLNFQAMSSELNALARESIGGYPQAIADLNRELQELAEQAHLYDSPEITARMEEIKISLRIREGRIVDTIARIGGGIRSEPDYQESNIHENYRYLFYKPVMLHLGVEDTFFWGIVRLEVSLSSIINEIEEGQAELLRVNLLIALAAQLVGAIGALLLSNYILKPIWKLVKHVETIRDTPDKSRLIGMDITLDTKDELAILGHTINDMTLGLIKAALAASELSIGKEFQKKFIPLELDAQGDKLSSGFEETTYLHIFGYYEGAKEVSGDYFDYQDLDGRYYAIIKCDVAGKGVSASFIMIQVATMFLNYCKHWQPTEKGMHIEELVYQINEFIESLAYKDRFAAFTLCLYDSHTGKARFCNAGDNIIYLCDASEKKIKTLFLPETPAAGALTNIMVESKGGYRVQTLTLDHGDMLLLFTDGIEESKRKFRNTDFIDIVCEKGPVDTPHANHVAGQGGEELGQERIKNIVNAVMNKKVYTLQKWHNGEGEDVKLQFDFRSCQGTVEEIIMALVAVEKMFRCYYNPAATEEDTVQVDRIVDAFLKKHFLQYRNYCSFIREDPANSVSMYYTRVMEDEQYDDLAILGLKRK